MDEAKMHTDRRDVDGAHGRGDMLGGLSTGAGGRLGLPGKTPAVDQQQTPIILNEGDENESGEQPDNNDISDPTQRREP